MWGVCSNLRRLILKSVMFFVIVKDQFQRCSLVVVIVLSVGTDSVNIGRICSKSWGIEMLYKCRGFRWFFVEVAIKSYVKMFISVEIVTETKLVRLCEVFSILLVLRRCWKSGCRFNHYCDWYIRWYDSRLYCCSFSGSFVGVSSNFLLLLFHTLVISSYPSGYLE